MNSDSAITGAGMVKNLFRKFWIAVLVSLFAGSGAFAHPHVFVEASLEIVLDKDGRFSKLRQVWRFDELFSATVVLDFDKNNDGSLDEAELATVSATVKKTISEFDFHTAMRGGSKVLEFYEPDEMPAYMEGDRLIMFFTVEPAQQYAFENGPLKVTASDASYYVAFDFSDESVTVEGGAAQCSAQVTHPDFDNLYASNPQMLTEAFFNNPDQPDLSDDFSSWAIVTC